MTGLGWFASIIVGGVAGWIAEKIMKGDHGLIKNVILGILGAVVMNFILTTASGSTLGGWFGQMIVGAAGACLLIWFGRRLGRS